MKDATIIPFVAPDHWDIIPDVHGQYDKLVELLAHLGYHSEAGFRHPTRRRLLFLGDLIDRGPRIADTLRLVRHLHEAGIADAVLGNHEINAIGYATPTRKGGHLRPHSEKNEAQHAATLRAFAGHPGEWRSFLKWMRTLPLFVARGDFFAVHAAWSHEAAGLVFGRSLEDAAFLRAIFTPGTAEKRAVDFLLKGPELRLPSGCSVTDKEGRTRPDVRVAWWRRFAPGDTFADAAFPPAPAVPEVEIPTESLPRFEWPADAPPVFFGHYWMPANAPLLPLARNVACLDFSAGKDGPLVAYRWSGERVLRAEHFVVAPTTAPPGFSLTAAPCSSPIR